MDDVDTNTGCSVERELTFNCPYDLFCRATPKSLGASSFIQLFEPAPHKDCLSQACSHRFDMKMVSNNLDEHHQCGSNYQHVSFFNRLLGGTGTSKNRLLILAESGTRKDRKSSNRLSLCLAYI